METLVEENARLRREVAELKSANERLERRGGGIGGGGGGGGCLPARRAHPPRRAAEPPPPPLNNSTTPPTPRRRTGRDQDRQAVPDRDTATAGGTDRVSHSCGPVQALREAGPGPASAPDLGCRGKRGIATGSACGGAGHGTEQGLGPVARQDGGGAGESLWVAGKPWRSGTSIRASGQESGTHL